MRRISAFGVAALACAVLCGLPAGAPAQAAQAGPPRTQETRPASARTPAAAAFPGQLTAVSAASGTGAWAVGGPLILHWNGRTWSRVTDPVPSASLQAVKAISAASAWAVGQYCSANCDGKQATFSTLILHWNGRTWSKVPSPSAGIYASLSGVTATSGSSAWAVGDYCTTNCETQETYYTLILHWNGRTWSKVASPDPGGTGGSFLSGVTATSGTSAWAVGDYCTVGCIDKQQPMLDTLILHWNGRTWSKVPSPGPGTYASLSGVTATSGSSAWAVGDYCTAHCRAQETYYTLILHWNGRTWSKVASPDPGGITGSFLSGVTATSGTSAWAVGYYDTSTAELTLILHWNGRTWSKVPSPGPGTYASLSGVTATSGTDAWAVGSALILHWNGRAWSLCLLSAGVAGVRVLAQVPPDQLVQPGASLAGPAAPRRIRHRHRHPSGHWPLRSLPRLRRHRGCGQRAELTLAAVGTSWLGAR